MRERACREAADCARHERAGSRVQLQEQQGLSAACRQRGRQRRRGPALERIADICTVRPASIEQDRLLGGQDAQAADL